LKIGAMIENFGGQLLVDGLSDAASAASRA
jgi:hypothetical protein